MLLQNGKQAIAMPKRGKVLLKQQIRKHKKR